MTALPVLKRGFRPLEEFRPTDPYRLLPFRFMRWSAEEVLLTNDGGEYLFVTSQDFARFVAHSLPQESLTYLALRSSHFLADGDASLAVDLLATKYRTKKSHLEGFTRLHLFVVTLRCEHTCRYCQVSRAPAADGRYDMSPETAAAAIDLVFRSPAPSLKIEFQGGESLLNFDRIRSIVETVEERNRFGGRQIEFVVASNLVPLTDEMLTFFREHDVCLSTSLDGPAHLHNANRPRPGGDSHARAVEGIARARRVLGHDRVSAVMTTTRRSLQFAVEVVDEYVEQGFDSIFLRPISPYGFAIRTGEAAKYEMSEFLEFYRRALDRVIEWNRRGFPLVEVYAQILLSKMLTPFGTGYVDLQSPAGLGIGAVVYNYDGDVYASDEARMLAEMRDHAFRLGNVHHDTYEDIFAGSLLRDVLEDSILEALPGCSDCAFLPFCGADPVFHHRTQGDRVGHRPTSAFCTKNMAIIRHLFDLLRNGDRFVRDLLVSWATNVSPAIGQERAV